MTHKKQMTDDGLYKVVQYPQKGYTNDELLQRQITARSKHIDKQMKRLFLSFLAVFVLSVIMALMGFLIVVLLCIGFAGLLFLAGIVCSFIPKCSCTACKKTLEKDYKVINDDSCRTGVFLICKDCRRFVYTHRSSR